MRQNPQRPVHTLLAAIFLTIKIILQNQPQ
jgi:hypothetical protein